MPSNGQASSRATANGSVWRKNFLLFCSGQTISKIGNGIYQVGLAWAVYGLTGSSADMGIVLALNFVPQLALVLIGGTLADRVSRRTVVITADGLAAAVTLALTVLAATHHLTVLTLMAGSFLLGTVSAFYGPAYAAMNSDLLSADDFGTANSLLTIAGNLARVLGPIAGGLSFALEGVPLLFGLDATSFIVAAVTMLFTRTAPDRQAAAERQNVLAELAAGVTYTIRSRWLLLILAISTIANCLCLAPYGVLLPALVRAQHAGPGAFGLLNGAQIAATVVGVMIIGRLGKRVQASGSLLLLASILGLGGMVLGYPRAALSTMTIGAVLIGGGMSLDVIENTLLQTLVPPQLLSRVYSVNMAVSYSLLPVGYAVSGLMARKIGPSAVLMTGGIFAIAACACAAFVLVLKHLGAGSEVHGVRRHQPNAGRQEQSC
jgi:MFS family permease